jgi:hypothetical protein
LADKLSFSLYSGWRKENNNDYGTSIPFLYVATMGGSFWGDGLRGEKLLTHFLFGHALFLACGRQEE